LHRPGGFRGWPIQWNHAQCCGADPCCHGNDMRRSSRLPVRIVCMSVTFYVVAKRHILAKNWLNKQIGLPPETTPRYQFGPPIPPLNWIIRIKDCACFRKPYVMFIISRSIRVRVIFTTAVRIAHRYLHWINSNPNTDPNPNPNLSVPVY